MCMLCVGGRRGCGCRGRIWCGLRVMTSAGGRGKRGEGEGQIRLGSRGKTGKGREGKEERRQDGSYK